jgi:amino acid adenylation domain-containing protein
MKLGYRTLLHEPLVANAALFAERPAIHCGEETCSYAELNERSDRVASALSSRGVERGDRVIIYMENSIAAAIAIYGVLKAGGVIVVVNPLTRQGKLAFIAGDCEVKTIATDVHSMAVVRAAAPAVASLQHIFVVGLEGLEAEPMGADLPMGEDALRPDGPETCDPRTIPTDLAALLYTSGSTGRPKGVMQTHQSMVFALGSVSEYLEICADDVILSALPLAFDYGLYQLFMAVTAGATLILERSFAYPGTVYQRMREHRVTVFPGVPTMFALMLGGDAASLEFETVRCVTNTAAALPTGFHAKLGRIFSNAQLCAMYGLTECKRVSYLPPGDLAARPASVGKAIPGTDVFLRSPTGDPVPVGAPGILFVRGPHIMRGYWNDPIATAEMLVDLGTERVLRTGDWFRMDEGGFLYFLGRSDDIIKTRGEKVSPAEVEDALYSISGVTEAAVVGMPDAVLGEAVRAYVVLAPDVERDERMFRRFLAERLESFMMPSEFVFCSELPKSANGKIRRRALAQRGPGGQGADGESDT